MALRLGWRLVWSDGWGFWRDCCRLLIKLQSPIWRLVAKERFWIVGGSGIRIMQGVDGGVGCHGDEVDERDVVSKPEMLASISLPFVKLGHV